MNVEPIQATKTDESSPEKQNSTRNMDGEQTPKRVKRSLYKEFFLCFSLKKNINSLLVTRTVRGQITSINGIRVLSMMWVVLGHYYAFDVLRNRPDNIVQALHVTQRFTFEAVANAYVSVDTFFLLSGLLFSYLTLKKLKEKSMRLIDVPLLYVHRSVFPFSLLSCCNSRTYPNGSCVSPFRSLSSQYSLR